MKKLFYMISAVALMASFASCNKVEQENTSTDNTPVETPVVGETTTITVSAAIPDTKTYWNNGQVKWLRGDMIKVLAEDGTAVMSNSMVYDDVVTGASSTYDFTVAEWPSDKTPLYAVFNQEYDDVVLDKENITLVLKGDQMAHHKNSFDKTANTSVGVLEAGESGAYTTQMKNVCGLLKFSIAKLDDVTEIVIKDKNEKSMAGTVKVKMVNGVPEVQEIVNGSSEVSLTVATNIGGENKYFPLSSFYVCVLPETYLPEITITSASAGPIVLTAKSEITVNRNEWIDFGAIDSAVSDSEEDEPVVPSETKTITLNFGAGWPLSPELAKYNSTTKAPQISEKTTYTLTQDDATYSFEVYSTGAGFYNTGTALRLCNSGTCGYITTPAISGFKLTGADVTITNSSSKKTLTLYSNCTVSEGVIVVDGEMENIEINATNTKNGSSIFSKTAENTSYYLYTASTNYQLGKLILTYTKVN